MKKITGVVIILAALVLGMYYAMGGITAHAVHKYLANVRQNDFSVQIVQYHRGWFKSEALLNWTFHIPEHVEQLPKGQAQTTLTPPKDYQILMPVVISHGPVVLNSKGVKFGLGLATADIQLPAEFIEQFNNQFTSQSIIPKLELSLFITYLYDVQLRLHVLPFSLITKQANNRLNMQGMTLTSSMKLNSSLHPDMIGQAELDRISFTKNQITTTLSSATCKYKLHQTDSGLVIGKIEFAFPSLLNSNNGKKLLEIDQLDINTDSEVSNGLFSSYFKMSVGNVIDGDNKMYGPGKLQLAIQNLDADALAKINGLTNQMHQSGTLESQKSVLALLTELPKLFSRGAEFEISEMSLTLPEGTIDANLTLSLPKENGMSAFNLVQKLQGESKLKFPTSIVKQVLREWVKKQMLTQQTNEQASRLAAEQQPQGTVDTKESAAILAGNSLAAIVAQDAHPVLVTNQEAINSPELMEQATTKADAQLESMVQSGVLTLQGNDYVVDLTLNQGQLKVNGKPFDFSMLKLIK